MAIWYVLWPFGMFYGHVVCFMAIFGNLIHSPHFGMLYQEKAGNPALDGCFLWAVFLILGLLF
jgi:hypothetical protein